MIVMQAKEKAKKNWTQKKMTRIFSSKSADSNKINVPSNNGSLIKDVPALHDKCPQNALEKWAGIVQNLLESRKNSLWERIDIIPRFDQLFCNIESKYGCRISTSDRKTYYSKFFKRASRSTTLTSSEMEQFLCEIGIATTAEQARNQIQLVLARYSDSLGEAAHVERDADQLDFEFFLSIICLEFQCKAARETDPSANASQSMLSRLFPIDPDGSAKQGWDFFCLVLLFYCSFSVPYDIAFLDDNLSSLSVLDIFGLVVDAVFMCDICLSFVTSVEMDGIVVRDLRVISATYARWLALASCNRALRLVASLPLVPP